MKTLREEWTNFFSQELPVLQKNYPGIVLQRFLLEVLDLLKLKYHPLLTLEQSSYGVSILDSQKLQKDFISGIPFAYLTHHSEFYDHSFYINEDVLIPRSETELLVDMLVKKAGKKPFKRALDVGTGSGVIILSLLAKNVVTQGMGADISSAALNVARINSVRLKVQEKCDFVLSDRLEKVEGKFDLIVSNPPYIKQKSHFNLVHAKVDEFEPRMALYLPDDEYEKWFSEFFIQVAASLNTDGLFMMEGHELELEAQASTLRILKFQHVEIVKDFAGLNRFLMAMAPFPR